MKKRIICILIMFVFVFSMTFNALAVNLGTSVGSYDGAPNVNQMMALYNKYVGGSYAYYYYHADSSYSGRSNCAWFGVMPSNYVLVKRSTTNSKGNYYTNLYYLDENDNITWVDPSKNIYYQYVPDDGGTFSYNTGNELYVTPDNKVLCNGQYDLAIESNIPIASSLDNASMFLKTGDTSYLDNPEMFVEVPTPQNISAYKASEENGIYLYWENEEGFEDGQTEVTDGSKVTRLITEFFYIDASNETKIAATPITERVNYAKRYQYYLPLDEVSQYDTGYIVTKLNNWYIFGNVDVEGERTVASSLDVVVRYDLARDKLYVTITDDNVLVDGYEISINDYGSKNDSFTGGGYYTSSDSGYDISSSDFNFFSYIFSGFGLLGDNGLIPAMGKFFSYLPKELTILLLGGVGAMICVAIFKLFVKA